MGTTQKMFCNKEYVDFILNNHKIDVSCKIAYKAMYTFGDLFLDISKDEIENIRTLPFFNKIFKAANRGVHSAPGWNKSGIIDFDNVSNEVCFIKPKYIPSHDDLKAKKGVLIADYNEKILKKMNIGTKCLMVKRGEKVPYIDYKDSWTDVFKRMIKKDKKEYMVPVITPINAAIITDNYLFKLRDYENRKKYSLFEILKAIVPKELEIPFHLTIFYYDNYSTLDDNYISEDDAKKIINEIKKLELCKEIKITIVAHNNKSKTHNRKILTNYHYIDSGIGFNNVGKNGVLQNTEVCIYSFYDSLFFRDDESHETTIKDHYENVRTWLRYVKKKEAIFIAGDDVNRLLDDSSPSQKGNKKIFESGEENQHT